MQALFSFALLSYLGCYAFEALIRYVLNKYGADHLIFARDVLLALPVLLLLIRQIVRRSIHPAYFVFAFIILLHGAVIILNMDSPIAAAYGAKILMTALAGALAAPLLLKPSRFMLWIFLGLWLVTGIGVALDKYEVVEFPWANMDQTTIGDIQVDISHNWETSGDDKRAAGFMRSSINVAIFEPILALILLFNLRFWPLRLFIALATLPILYFTTQKGAIIAYALTLGCLLLWPRRPVIPLKAGFLAMLAVMCTLPLTLPGSLLPRAKGIFSLSSFNQRVEQMWPDAWSWIARHEAFPFGVGLGGIGGAQRFYAPNFFNAADNLFICLYAFFGVMAVVYLLWTAWVVIRLPNDSPLQPKLALAILVFLVSYGCVLSLIEDQMASLFLGACLTAIAGARAVVVPRFSRIVQPLPAQPTLALI